MTMKTLICSGLVCALWRRPPAACAAQPAPAGFDGNRAYEHLRQVVGIGPRTPRLGRRTGHAATTSRSS